VKRMFSKKGTVFDLQKIYELAKELS
jgi:hypothetical protein